MANASAGDIEPPQAEFDEDEFWDDLLAFIEQRRVVPVLGSELLKVEQNGCQVSLYRAVAEKLLAKYKLAAELREHHELHSAVVALAERGKRIKDLYRPINDILQDLAGNAHEPLPALIKLAQIRHFDLFAVTTPDTCLARALDAVRYGSAPMTDQIEYAPSLPTERRRDIPEIRPSNYTALFYLFGRADASPFYAIHDEDALEFSYTLQHTIQNGVPPVRIFSELRRRSLLLIGCNFDDWLSRFFLRLSNEKRLSSEERPKKEFLVDQSVSRDRNLITFLERFSRDSRCCPLPAGEFVDELHRRWNLRNPSSGQTDDAPTSSIEQSQITGSIFISYAREDIDAARKLSKQLEEVGADIAWFDKSALRPGDDWNRSIIAAVQRCRLFLPLISANTEHRSEGYFRREWNEAADRSRRIQGKKFIMPVVIDEGGSSDVGAYELLPDAFRSCQATHAPGGWMSREFRLEIDTIVKELRRGKRA